MIIGQTLVRMVGFFFWYGPQRAQVCKNVEGLTYPICSILRCAPLGGAFSLWHDLCKQLSAIAARAFRHRLHELDVSTRIIYLVLLHSALLIGSFQFWVFSSTVT